MEMSDIYLLEAHVTAQVRQPTRVTVVHAPACHFCDDAEQVLGELSATYAIAVHLVDIDSPEGRELISTHRPAMNPLVLLDGAFFSTGRLPRKKLAKALEQREAVAGASAVSTTARAEN